MFSVNKTGKLYFLSLRNPHRPAESLSLLQPHSFALPLETISPSPPPSSRIDTATHAAAAARNQKSSSTPFFLERKKPPVSNSSALVHFCLLSCLPNLPCFPTLAVFPLPGSPPFLPGLQHQPHHQSLPPVWPLSVSTLQSE